MIGTNTLYSTGGESVFVAKFSFNCQPDNVASLSSNNNNVLIFPNPNNGFFKLQIDSEIENGELFLYSSIGQKVHEQKISQRENSVSLSNLAKGLYTYQLFQSKQPFKTGKISIE